MHNRRSPYQLNHVTGNTISTQGEWDSGTAVPMELMLYSIKQAAPVDLSVQVFGSPHQDIEATPEASSNMDHLLRLVSAVFRLAHILRQSMDANLGKALTRVELKEISLV